MGDQALGTGWIERTGSQERGFDRRTISRASEAIRFEAEGGMNDAEITAGLFDGGAVDTLGPQRRVLPVA
jgi:hypothetical protein